MYVHGFSLEKTLVQKGSRMCDNLVKRQCNFYHFFTIIWRLESDTVATRLTVHWRTLTYCALVESRASVNFFFSMIRGKKDSNPISIISNEFIVLQLASLEILKAVLVKSN